VKHAITILAISAMACGPDPNELIGGRAPRHSIVSTSDNSGDQGSSATSDGEGQDGTTGGGTGGATSSGNTTPSSTPTSTPTTTPTSTPTTTPTTTPPAATTAEQVCVDTINSYRKTLNLPPLARWTGAETCSDSEATSDGQTGQAHGAFPKCGEFAQNECPGWPGPSAQMIPGCLKAMWAEGPGGGHYENMRSSQWTQVSCGFSTLPNGDVWAVQNFK
jgi:hypothetical protein